MNNTKMVVSATTQEGHGISCPQFPITGLEPYQPGIIHDWIKQQTVVLPIIDQVPTLSIE